MVTVIPILNLFNQGSTLQIISNTGVEFAVFTFDDIGVPGHRSNTINYRLNTLIYQEYFGFREVIPREICQFCPAPFLAGN